MTKPRIASVAVRGLDRSFDVEGAVDRWVARLERVRPISRCTMSICVDSYMLGLGRRVRIDLSVVGVATEVAICRTTKLRDPSDIYFAISDAFRDVHRRLDQLAAGA